MSWVGRGSLDPAWNPIQDFSWGLPGRWLLGCALKKPTYLGRTCGGFIAEAGRLEESRSFRQKHTIARLPWAGACEQPGGGQVPQCQGPEALALQELVSRGLVGHKGSPSSCGFLALAPGGARGRRRAGLGRSALGCQGQGERSGLAQELGESMSWSRLEPWKVNSPGEVTEKETER